MKFKIPNTVQVGGAEYSVIMQKGLGADAGKYGETAHFSRVVRLDPDQSENEMRDTFLHEIIHAIDVVLDCDLKETQVKRISTGLYQVFRQLQQDE